MAQLYINSVTTSTFKWSISGLSNNFNSTNYTSAGISLSPFTSGTTSRPNVLTYTTVWTNTTSTNSITFTHGLSAGTYTLYGFTASGGKYWSCGSETITVPSPQPIPNPYSWSWTTTERYALDNKGKVSTITYQRWNEFCEQVRLTTIWYWGYEKYDFNSAKMSPNSKTMTATRFRIIRDAIGSMNSTGITDDLIQTGRTVYGWYFVRLSERFNSITKTPTYSVGTMEQLYNMDALMISAKIEDINKEVKNGDR